MNKKIIASLGLFLSFSCLVGFNASKSYKSSLATGKEYSFNDPLWSNDFTIEDATDDEYTLAFIGDTQKTIEYYPELVNNSFQWLADNKERLNLKYVIGVGDVVDDVDYDLDSSAKIEEQCQDAFNAYSILKNNDVPFAVALGNHDYEDMAMFDRRFDLFGQYFTLDLYNNNVGFVGSKDNTIENTYHYFEANGEKFMVLVIGHHPDQSILDWADKILSENSDRKVIFATHGYMDAGSLGVRNSYPYYEFKSGGYGGRTPFGEVIFKEVLSKHENVIMTCCGHEIGQDAKRIVRADCYGDNGNVIHQFMTNPMEIENGGSGLIFLLKVNKNGTATANYYCPTNDAFYNPESQFEFDMNSNVPNTLLEQNGKKNVLSSDLTEDFTIYQVGSESYKNNAYVTGGTTITNTGLTPLDDGASITYAFESGKDKFKDLYVSFDYASNNRHGGVAVAISPDGEDYKLMFSADGIDQGARKIAGNTYREACQFREYVSGWDKIFVKLIFLNGSVDNLSISNLTIKTLKAKTIYEDTGSFGINLNFKDYERYDIANWSKDAIYTHDLLIFDGVLGTGRVDDYSGAKGEAIWEFDAPEGATIDSLNIKADGRLIQKDGRTTSFEYGLKIETSIDGGKTYQDFVKEGFGSKTSFSYDLSTIAKGVKEIRVKIILWGDYWNTACLNNLKIEGNYRFNINYEVGEGQNSPMNPTTYATSNDDLDLSDPTAPEYFVFAGWYDNPNFEGEPTYWIPAGTHGEITYYAKYDPITYNIIYNLNGGKNSSNNARTFEAYRGCELYDASRNGYSFMGWYDNPDFSGNPITSIPAGTTEDVTLYAKFLKNYRISYVLAGGILDEKIESFTADDEIVLPIPTKDNYDFDGWYLEKEYINKIERIAKGTEENIIVYAKWTKHKQEETSSETTSMDDSSISHETSSSSGDITSSGCGGSIATTSILISLISIGGLSIILKKKHQ